MAFKGIKKYFKMETILGIGIGFILSAILIGLYPQQPQITNQQVIQMAKNLGMMTLEEYKAALNSETDKIKTGQNIDNPQNKNNSNQVPIKTEPVKNGPETPETKTATKTDQKPTAAEETQKVKVHIPAGSGSEEIAAILKDEGVIKNAADFRQAIAQRNAERRFQKGDFILPAGGSYDEIIDILTQPTE